MHQPLRSCSILSTFSIIWWEYLTTFDDEFECIWRRPINNIKYIFLLSRYLPLIVLTINVILLFGPLGSPHVDTRICRALFVLLMCSIFTMYAALEVFLVTRVYALYQRNIKVALFLGILLAVEVVFEILCVIVTVRDGKFRSDNCDAKGIPREVFYFGGSSFLSQLSLWTLTYFRRNIVDGTVPVIRLMTRDGFSAFIITCAVMAMTLPYSTVSEYSSAHIIFDWPIALVSVLTCRMIVNMKRLNVGGAASSYSADQSQIFTSCILEASTA